MPRLDINKILSRARRAEKKFSKLDKEFRQEHQEVAKTFFKKIGENTAKQLPKKLLTYENHGVFQKIAKGFSRGTAVSVQKTTSFFLLFKNAVLSIISTLGFLFGKVGKVFMYLFGFIAGLFKSFLGVFRRGNKLPAPKPKTVSQPPKQTWTLVTSGISSSFNKKIIFGIAAIVLVIIFVPLLMYSVALTDCGSDPACFGGLANQCKQAKYTGIIAGATVSVVARDCQLTKTILNLPETEPESIRTLFAGKSMKCVYPSGDFDSVYLEKITGNLQTCSGELIDAIQKVAIG